MSLPAMSKSLQRIAEIAKKDGRYKREAYLFIQQALAYAQFELGMGRPRPYGVEGEVEDQEDQEDPLQEAHLTGQELCEAIRLYAADLFGLMAQVVLNNWGIYETRDFGEIVYNLISIGEMTKSETDCLEDFDQVYDFDTAFRKQYEITLSDES